MQSIQLLQTLRCKNALHMKRLYINSTYIHALLTKREVKMAGYWSNPIFAFLWTSTSSRSMKRKKKNLANIQPS